MSPQELKERILTTFPGAEVTVVDLTGTQDHYSVTVCTDDFEGLLPIRRHRLVNQCLRDELRSGEIHALQLTTVTCSESAQ